MPLSFRIHARKFHMLPTNSLASIFYKHRHLPSILPAITWLGHEWATQFPKVGSFKVGGFSFSRDSGVKNSQKKSIHDLPGCKNPKKSRRDLCLQVRSWKNLERSVVLLQHCVERHPGGELEGFQNIGSVGSKMPRVLQSWCSKQVPDFMKRGQESWNRSYFLTGLAL